MMRSVAAVGGTLLYVYTAVQQAAILRSVQQVAGQAADMVVAQLPAQYAVWLPSLNLEMSLTFPCFGFFN